MGSGTITSDLNMHRITAKVVPRHLSPDQKELTLKYVKIAVEEPNNSTTEKARLVRSATRSCSLISLTFAGLFT